MPEIDSQFRKIFNLISPGPGTGGGGGGPGGIAQEPVTGDSLTQFLRSTSNLMGSSGAGALQQGGNVFSNALSSFEAPFNYYSNILAGDPAATSAAIAPDVANIDKVFGGAEKSVGQGAARGGFRSASMAELPFQKAGSISESVLKQRGGAAAALTQISQMIAALGASQEGLGAGLLGATEQGQLARRGQNLQEDQKWTQLFGDLGKSVGLLVGGGLSGGIFSGGKKPSPGGP